jgi:hypothetical protein
MRGGQLNIGASSANGQMVIELTMLANNGALDHEDFWVLDSADVGGSWLWKVLLDVVERDGGQLETSVVDPAGHASNSDIRYSKGRAVRFSYRAAIPSSLDTRDLSGATPSGR